MTNWKCNCGVVNFATVAICKRCRSLKPQFGYSGQGSRQCYFCKEEILMEAIKCKHCGEYLYASVKKANQNPDYQWTPGRVILLIIGLAGLFAGLFLLFYSGLFGELQGKWPYK